MIVKKRKRIASYEFRFMSDREKKDHYSKIVTEFRVKVHE